MLFCQGHDFIKGLPGVISTDWVVFHIPHMAVSSNENADSVLSLSWYSYSIPIYISLYKRFLKDSVSVPAGVASLLAGGAFLPESLAGGCLPESLGGGGSILPESLGEGGSILPGSLAGGGILPESSWKPEFVTGDVEVALG